MVWTVEMEDELRQMWAEGLTANEIAKRLDVSKNSIVGKVHRLCLPARPSPIKKKENAAAENPELPLDVAEEAEEKTETDTAVVADAKKNEVGGTVKKKLAEHNIKLVELDSHTCRWPLGDPRDEDFCFCGKRVRIGQTYCEEHSMMAYVKANKGK
jgi:GcrA cell cycle regulator